MRCVLIRPPIPCITSSRCNFVLKSFCFIKELTQGSPLVTNLIFFLNFMIGMYVRTHTHPHTHS